MCCSLVVALYTQASAESAQNGASYDPRPSVAPRASRVGFGRSASSHCEATNSAQLSVPSGCRPSNGDVWSGYTYMFDSIIWSWPKRFL